MDKRQHLLDRLTFAVSKGATAVKLELEAQLDRGASDDDDCCSYCDDGYVTCHDCYGSEVECRSCNASGQVPVMHEVTGLPTAETMTCQECNGDGEVSCYNDCDNGTLTCDECDGQCCRADSGNGFSSARTCLEFMLANMGLPSRDVNTEGGDIAYTETAADWLPYIRFYNDHSVDSEVTATVPIKDDVTTIFKLEAIVNAFIALSDAIGNGLDVDGAGMHISFLFNEDCIYPDRENRLPDEQLINYRKSMKQLLPALYFLGATNSKTREMYYRQPNISVGLRDEVATIYDRNHKYSAIYYNGNAMEFRVFDTCYGNIQQLWDNIVVMCNSLEYLDSRYKNPGLDKLTDRYRFGHDNGRELDRLYGESTHLDLLSKGLKRLKPAYYTINELKKQRTFKRTKRTITTELKRAEDKAKRAYEEYAERLNYCLIYQADEIRASYLRDTIERSPREELRGMSEEQLRQSVEQRVQERLEAMKNGRTTPERYVQDYIKNFNEQRQGRYTVQFC